MIDYAIKLTKYSQIMGIRVFLKPKFCWLLFISNSYNSQTGQAIQKRVLNNGLLSLSNHIRQKDDNRNVSLKKYKSFILFLIILIILMANFREPLKFYAESIFEEY